MKSRGITGSHAGDLGGHKKPTAGRVDRPVPLKIPEA